MRQFETNPLPGMNPWLEARWPDIHTRLTTYSADAIQEQLPPDLFARTEEYLSVQQPLGPARRISPDASVIEAPDVLASSSSRNAEGKSAVLDEPVRLFSGNLTQTLRYITITDAGGNRVVTTIEFLSPANKVTREGRDQYRNKRQTLIEGGASIVEIDLTRRGEWVLAIDESSVPDELRDPYRICVLRHGVIDQVEMYPASFAFPLPNIRIPLRPEDDDIGLSLQPLIDQAYVKGRYGLIDYEVAPLPRLTDHQQSWLRSYLDDRSAR